MIAINEQSNFDQVNKRKQVNFTYYVYSVNFMS